MTDGSFFLDTSIPIYAAGKPSDHKEACAAILEKIEKHQLNATIDTEVVQEILYRFHRLEMDRPGLELCQNVLRLGLRVLPVVKRDIEDVLPLFEKYFPRKVPLRDMIHTAVMINNGIAKIITLDRHFGDIVSEVERVDPMRLLS
jgi:predicted nucleic acid-binding protein